MKVQIGSVRDKGDIIHERLVLRVKRGCGHRRLHTSSDGLSRTAIPPTRVENTLWFPDMPTSAGDIVVVYSKSGRARQKKISGDRTAHFFYWHQDSALWDDETVAPVLLYSPAWASKAPHELVDSSS